jgi:phosphatidylglycerol:prolipoprotein diacylglycerol transferase
MHPELFQVPFTELTVKTYGLMMVIGFMTAVWIIRWLSRKITPDPQLITNAALYSLIAGVGGARLFYVVHYWENFRADLLSIFAIWQGGLELLGGVLLAITVILLYLLYHKLPVRQYLDILAIGLMAALIFGRIGCFFNGCCFGKPTELPWAVRFPYGSDAYESQIHSNPKRNRPEPYIKLPPEYFSYESPDGIRYLGLKPLELLTDEQYQAVTQGQYRCLPIHPTQLYSSAMAAFICLMLYLFWRRSQTAQKANLKKFLTAPGCTFALMFVLYGVGRFGLEFLRNDNPYEFKDIPLTISQYIGMGLFTFGIIQLIIYTAYAKSKKPAEIQQPEQLQQDMQNPC